MSWDIEVHEKVYQRLANEIFFRILRGEYALGAKLPSYIDFAKEAGSSPRNSSKIRHRESFISADRGRWKSLLSGFPNM